MVGHDIGGGIAQLVAINHPEILARLALIDSILYDSFPEPGIACLKEPVWDEILGAPDFDLKKGLAKGFSRGIFHTDRVTAERVETYERPFHGIDGRHAYLRAARALKTEEFSSRMKDVEKPALPTLVVWGRLDTFQPLHFAERLAGKMPNVQIQVFDEAGHFLPEDVPEALASRIAEFASSQEGAR